MHQKLRIRYALHGKQLEYRLALLSSSILFFVSVIFNFYSGIYATSHASNYVQDIILTNIPVFDVGGVFVWGAIVLIVFIIVLSLIHPKRIPFVLHSLSLFFFIRGSFVSLTHLGPFPTQATLDVGGILAKQFGGADFFFSAHTGIPFLMALVFWKEKVFRIIFLVWSVFFGCIVLLGHLHYSIDVFSAFFITYSIYELACWLFPIDKARFNAVV